MHEQRSNEVNDFSPTSLSHIVGQTSVVEQVRVALDAAFEDSRKMDSCLMVGPPGCGKSALAQVIAAEIATDFHEVLGQSIATPADLNALLLAAQEKSIVHIDEAHELRKEFQTALYLAVDQPIFWAKSASTSGRSGTIELLMFGTMLARISGGQSDFHSS
jgi:Holliday junction DNA helicase RuvB